MIARLLSILRSMRAYWDWLAEMNEMARTDDAVYAADTRDLALARHPLASECPIQDCRTCLPDPLLTVSSLDPMEVGRQKSEGAAILDISAWLRASGFEDMELGEVQRYACWLRKARAAYEEGSYQRV